MRFVGSLTGGYLSKKIDTGNKVADEMAGKAIDKTMDCVINKETKR